MSKYQNYYLFRNEVFFQSLIFHVEVALLAVAVVGLYNVSQICSDSDFEPVSIPGFDGLPWNGESKNKFYNKVIDRPHLTFAKNALNVFSYFFIFRLVGGSYRLNQFSV